MEATVIAALITSIVTLVISLISGVLTVVKMYLDYKKEKKDRGSQEKIAESVQEAEDNRTKIQIDANVVWTARVEWIQNVRNITAELLATVNNYILSRDIETQKKNLEVIREKKELLILYFGPDKKSNAEVDILDNTSNESKNEKIVELINKIYEGAYYYFQKSNLINQHHNNVLKCKSCECSSDMYESCEIVENGNMLFDEQDRRCKEYKDYNLQIEHKYVLENDELKKNISKLTEVMRVYLKIEWNRAKERTSI